MNLGYHRGILGLNFALLKSEKSHSSLFAVLHALFEIIFANAIVLHQIDTYSLTRTIENKTMFPAELIAKSKTVGWSLERV